MGCLSKILLFPLEIIVWLFLFTIRLMIFPFKLMLGWLTGNNKKKYKTIKFTNNNSNENSEQFEKEAKLWGLSYSDATMAKKERMSPSDFIEAEERDDDNLDTDD